MPKPTESSAPIYGLSGEAAAARLRSDGYNELPQPDHRTILRIVFEVVRQPMFALLLIGGAIYLLLGDRAEALILVGFATFSVSITIVQEARSERVLEALRDLASPRALVIRDGCRIRIPGREVVRDDVFVLSEGDRVPADAILFVAHDVLLDESLLTGESVPVRKAATTIGDPKNGEPAAVVAGDDDLPHVFAGTLVVRGNGLARVTATGLRSEIGKIGRSLGTIELEQPRLQQQIRWVVRDFAIIGAIAGLLVVALYGLLRGSWLNAALGGIAVGMSLLPEEFPLVIAVFMAMGAWRISRARVLTRRAAAIETLGSATVLCTDKTGTLTENRMSLTALATESENWQRQQGNPPPASLSGLMKAAVLASAQQSADPMDKAVHDFAVEFNASSLDSISEGREVVRAYGLRADLLAMANVWASAGDIDADVYAKGAPEAVIRLCGLADEQSAQIRISSDFLAERGVRVLGVASARARVGSLPKSQSDFAFRFLGLIGFADPLRANVPDAVRQCRSAGIRVVMITGDYPKTALAIAAQAGITTEGVVTGDDIQAMGDTEFAKRVQTCSVFARVRPAQKLKIVDALKKNGEIVAMTGDGVNDAPAMKAAHIGIAMGGRGTDVAREASSLVLLDDDFGSIVRTIRLGRRIYDNLRKAMGYIVAVHVPIGGLAVLPLVFGLPLILWPVHIAFLEMVIDPACSVVFEAETEEDDVMRRPPRKPDDPLLSGELMRWGLLQGLFALSATAAAFAISYWRGMPETEMRALVFVSLVLTNFGLILVNRSFSASFWAAFDGSNRALWVMLVVVSIVLGVTIWWPTAQQLFRFGPLHADDLATCLGIGAIALAILERFKPRWRSHTRSMR